MVHCLHLKQGYLSMVMYYRNWILVADVILKSNLKVAGISGKYEN